MLVLVVDDDRAVREALERALQLEGYEVELASDGDAALAAIERRTPDAVVLDVMMPGYDGLDVTRRLRREGNRVPVLLLTARDAVGDRVEGLDGRRRLPAQAVRARRAGRPHPRAAPPLARPGACGCSPLRRPDLRPRLDGGAARRAPLRAHDDRGASARALPPQPAAGAAAAADDERVWGYDFSHSSNALDVYVGYLRRKTEAESEARLIHTVRGTGYVLREP